MNTNMTPTRWLTLSQLRRLFASHCLRMSEIPVEHYVSLPLPTRRTGEPGYAGFAAPAVNDPDAEREVGPPDRWWVLDGRSAHIAIYALWHVVPFAEGLGREAVTLPDPGRSVAEVQQDLDTIVDLVDELAASFFANETGEARSRRALAELLTAYLPAPLQPVYRALVPDFFAWLEA